MGPMHSCDCRVWFSETQVQRKSLMGPPEKTLESTPVSNTSDCHTPGLSSIHHSFYVENDCNTTLKPESQTSTDEADFRFVRLATDPEAPQMPQLAGERVQTEGDKGNMTKHKAETEENDIETARDKVEDEGAELARQVAELIKHKRQKRLPLRWKELYKKLEERLEIERASIDLKRPSVGSAAYSTGYHPSNLTTRPPTLSPGQPLTPDALALIDEQMRQYNNISDGWLRETEIHIICGLENLTILHEKEISRLLACLNGPQAPYRPFRLRTPFDFHPDTSGLGVWASDMKRHSPYDP